MKSTEPTKYREEFADDTDRRLTVCIVDDNPAALRVLADDLQAMPAIREVRTFSSYQEALLPLRDPDCDVLFLDVEMDGMNGLDYLHMIRQNGELPFHVVFYTAYSRYMLDAIRYSAADFLLKPYKHEELSGIVERLVMLVENSDIPREMQNPDLLPPSHRLAIRTMTELLLLAPEEIFCFTHSIFKRNWEMLLSDGSKQLLYRNVNSRQLQNLHPSFMRINQNTIVNISYLTAVENASLRCRFCPPFDHWEMTVSRRYFRELKERLSIL